VPKAAAAPAARERTTVILAGELLRQIDRIAAAEERTRAPRWASSPAGSTSRTISAGRRRRERPPYPWRTRSRNASVICWRWSCRRRPAPGTRRTAPTTGRSRRQERSRCGRPTFA